MKAIVVAIAAGTIAGALVIGSLVARDDDRTAGPPPTPASSSPTLAPLPPRMPTATTPVATNPGETTSAPPSEVPPSSTVSEPLPEPPPPPVPTEAMLAAADAFAKAWVIPDPTVRGEALRPVTTPQLLEGLVTTSPDNIPRVTLEGGPTLVRTGPWGAEARQRFTGGDPREIAVLVVPHPDTESGWAVSSVRPIA